MLDFDIKFRWFRLLYVSVLALFIFFLAGWIPAAICMLTVFDVTFDKDLFESKDEDSLDDLLDDPPPDDRGFGPNS